MNNRTLIANNGLFNFYQEKAQESSDLILVVSLKEYISDKHILIDSINNFTQTQSFEGVIKPLLVRDNEVLFKYPKGKNVSRIKWGDPNNEEIYIDIILKVLKVLDFIHQSGEIHDFLTPEMFFYDQESKGIAIFFPGVIPVKYKTNDLLYIAPESTGRLNCQIDYRSDYFTLGLILLNLLTGLKVFKTENPLEMVYQLMDGSLNSILNSLNHNYRSSITRVIKKLIMVDPLKRYQSAYELEFDLQQCITECTNSSAKLLYNTLSSNFKITDKLISRSSEVSTILNNYKDIEREGQIALLISGSAGIGKSSLIKSITPEISKLGGLCLLGKYDQYSNEPYNAIKVAISSLVDHLLTMDKEYINALRSELLHIMGINGGIFLEVFPSFKKITGPLTKQQNITPKITKSILNRILIDVMHLIAVRKIPLVLILDDLQWIDSASFDLLSILFKIETISNFFLIGTYRDNEIDEDHLLTNIIADLKISPFKLIEIALKPLDISDIELLITESFQLHNSVNLAEIIFKKTKGIPLYIKLFIKTMFDDGVLKYESGRWRYKIDDVYNSKITENVALIVVKKIDKLPYRNKQVLSLAASLGFSFYFDELVLVTEKNPYDVISVINHSITDEFIVFEHHNLSKERYSFSHDKIQQAFYDLIPDSDKSLLHLDIARKIYKQLDNREVEDRVFELLHHFNRSKTNFNTQERILISQLNLMAGEKALSSVAWDSSYHYFKTGIDFLSKDHWNDYYDLSLNLFTKGAELALLCGDYYKMDEWISSVEKNSNNILHKVEVWKIMLQSMFARKKMPEAIILTKKYLSELGIKVPNGRKRVSNLFHSFNIQRKINKIGVDNFQIQEKMDNDVAVASLEILIFGTTSVYISYPYMFQFFSIKMMDIVINHGFTYKGIFAIQCFAQIVHEKHGIELAYRLGEKATLLADSYSDDCFNGRVYGFFAGLSIHLKTHLRESYQFLESAHKNALKYSDLEYVAISLSFLINYMFFSGDNLQHCLYKADEIIDELTMLKQYRGLSACLRHRQVIKVFLGLTTFPGSFSDSQYHEEIELKNAIKKRDYNHVAIYYIYKMMISYYFTDYDKAMKYYYAISETSLLSISGQFGKKIYYYFYCLILLSLCPKAGLKRVIYMRKINTLIRKIKIWAVHSPDNHKHRYYFVSAEKSRICGKTIKAMKLYNLAINTASEKSFTNDKALILEKTALFYKDINMMNQYRYHMKKAYATYNEWGAITKLDHLESYCEDIIFNRDEGNFSISKYLDYMAILDATQAISGEVIEEKLLKKVITTILKTTGAERAFFFLTEGDNIILKASGDIKSNDISIKNSSVKYASSVVNYVYRTGESIIVNKNSNSLFLNDKYMTEESPKSILCQPIIREKNCIGVIYLENNISDTLFNESISNIVNILSTQVAISIENANLYDKLNEQHKRQQSLEEENNEHLLELIHAEKLASVGFLIAEVAHEINNPNQAILLNAAHLKDFSSDILTIIDEYYQFDNDLWVGGIEYKEFKTLFSEITLSIEKSSIQINALINELKRFIYKDTNEEIVDVDFNSVISSTLIISSYYLKKATKHFEFIPGEIPKVKGNFQRFQQVVLNLLRNSCQALNNRDGAIKITTFYPNGSKYIIIKISDEGCGISREDLAKISEPFYTTKGKTGGTGLGLYISKSIISKAGGLFDITSQKGNGTTITISLPVVEYEKISK